MKRPAGFASRWIVGPLALALPLLAAIAAPAPAAAQSATLEPVECLPVAEFTPVRARVVDEPPASEVRLYFRRLHEEVEDFYYVVMEPIGDGRYWAVLPKPEDEELEERELEDPETDEEEENLEAAWWIEKDTSRDRDPNDDLDEDVIEERAQVGGVPQPRDWMRAMELVELEEWFEDLHDEDDDRRGEGDRYEPEEEFEEESQEPAELYVAIYDARNQLVAESPIGVTYVREECDVDLTAEEEGYANNLVIGETAPWQQGEEVFHWLCDGIVTRINHLYVKREDEQCRACVVAWWKTKKLLPLVAAAILVPELDDDDDEDDDDDVVSPSDPDDDD